VAFRAGQTFLYPLDEDNRTSHLWIIITEPNSEQRFAVASFTSLKGAKDQTVILGKAEHPFLKWETCVSSAQHEITALGSALHGSENSWHRQTGDYAVTVGALLDAGAKAPRVTDDLEASEEVREVLREREESTI
jgi:hypothetical protein